ncbi:MAG: heterodisulfide reductase-related iron-sulfur binding cluster [Thermodesulfobacteriota bacterium]|nr:heterodisulfide reductase-related iron-sulfur binding cluster [Thermodesulfobacteriota bacterium]
MNLNLEDFKYDTERCTRCKGCYWVDHIYMPGIQFSERCPSLTRYLLEAYSAFGRLRLAWALLEGRIDYSPTLLDVIYKCTLGGACDAGCKRNLDLEPILTMETLRARCVKDGVGPMPEHKEIADGIAKSHNRFGSPQTRTRWLPDNAGVSRKADIIYFAGCATSYSDHKTGRAVVDILNSTGTEFSVMDEEWCCGYLLYTTGQVDKAREHMAHNIEAIKGYGARTVLTNCAECYKTLKVDYPKLLGISTADMGFNVLHLTEFLEKLLGNGGLKFEKEIPLKVTYHDPCNLGRLSEPWINWEGKRVQWGCLDPPKEFRRCTNGIYESPRYLLREIPGLEFIDMPRHRENAWCCGSGGGVKAAFNDFALWAAEKRIEEAESIGAEAIISCCPQCEDNLREAVKDKKIKIYDMAEIIQRAI